MRRTIVVLTLASWSVFGASVARAQTWSLQRKIPSLFEIIAVDAAGGNTGWPYGTEDLAGDGAQTLMDDEAGVDARSVYADARAGKLWLRAYVAGKSAPTQQAVAFFFIDTDARTSTGGTADDVTIWPALSADPTPGGYERAIGMRGDGTLLGVYFWDAQRQKWTKQPANPPLAVAEAGTARDPLRLLGDDHGYFQVQLALSVAQLDDTCNANIFVRTWNDATGKRAFGDDAGQRAAQCRPTLDRYGNPVPLHSDACTSDASCPAQGRCIKGVCVFGYECAADSGCLTGQRCDNGVCVRVVDKSCQQSSQCDGLVCVSGQCTACSASGARACDGGYVCAPDGSCLPVQAGSAGKSGAGGNGGSAPVAGSGGQVRGGAFSCSAARRAAPAAGAGWAVWAGLCAAAVGLRRRRARQRRARKGGDA